MLRPSLLAFALLSLAAPASAQDSVAIFEDPAVTAAEAGDPGVDFILRPTQSAGEDFLDDIWADQLAPEGPPVGASETAEAGATAAEPAVPVRPASLPAPPAEPVQPRRTARRDDAEDPFAAVGKRLGSFILRPAIELGVNLSDNPAGADGESAVGIVVAPELSLDSEDDDHAIAAIFRGEAIYYGDQELDEREAEARVRARYELSAGTWLETEAGYLYELERFSDPDTPDAAAERPAVHNFDAALGVTRDVGRIGIGVGATLEREVHEDVPLADGGTASRGELDNTEYGLRLRASHNVGTALAPFVEGAVGRRDFDQERDNAGFRRGSVWGELRGGLIFDFGSKLNGEVSAGWRHEDIDDDRLEDIDAIAAAAAILWSPRRLTDVRIDFRTAIEPTSIAEASGSVIYSGTFSVARRLSPRLRLEAGAGIDHEDFVGFDRQDVTYLGFAELTYSFNRMAAVKARYTYERTDSTDPAGDQEENAVGVRLRLQR